MHAHHYSFKNVFYDVMRSRHCVCACRVLADRALVYLNGTLGLAGQIIDLKTKASKRHCRATTVRVRIGCTLYI